VDPAFPAGKAEDTSVDPADPSKKGAAHEQAEDDWPDGPPGGKSLFCFAVFIPWTVEPKLLETQLTLGSGIFACDDFAMYSNPAGTVGGVKVSLLDMDMHVPRGGKWNTYLNTPMFKMVWGLIVADGRWRQHDWIVKADPDCVFIPERLRDVVSSAEYAAVNRAGSRGAFLNNCFLGLHGPLEVVSRAAMYAYHRQTSNPDAPCSSDEREDVYLMECLLAAGVEQKEDERVLAERDCNREGHAQSPDWQNCTGTEAAFHPFKTVMELSACLNKAIR
jgi:hypothetical protein